MLRRSFLATAAAAPAAFAIDPPAQTAIPRWRGFNLLDYFQALPRDGGRPQPTPEDLFKWVRDWGFNFVRIPMDYWLWIDSDWQTSRKLQPEDTFKIKDAAFDPIDRLVELARKYSLHISLNLHRAPGYCINNSEREPFLLWSDNRAEEAFSFHWYTIAKRYKSVSNFDLSLNLLNEAPAPKEGYMSREDYRRVMTRALNAIRSVTPTRPVIIDGLSVGNQVVDEMIDTGVAQSVHAYFPGEISHYRASWVDRNMDFPDPSWPLLNADGTPRISRKTLEDRCKPWADLARKGIGVHCGEAGCFSKTPHAVMLAWMNDVLDILSGYNIGYAMWNLNGPFGILDTGRTDVALENWHGRTLDRKLLELMQKY
jgi:aryl-phospho-beta-D-glucosidase BglC (GH1 family)